MDKFADSFTDGRAKYLEWCEKVKDRCELFDITLARALIEVAGKGPLVSAEDFLKMGIIEQTNAELQGFLREHSQGTAVSIVRDNMGGMGLEFFSKPAQVSFEL